MKKYKVVISYKMKFISGLTLTTSQIIEAENSFQAERIGIVKSICSINTGVEYEMTYKNIEEYANN